MQVSANEMVPRPSESAGIDALYLFGVYDVGSQGRRYSGRLGIGPRLASPDSKISFMAEAFSGYQVSQSGFRYFAPAYLWRVLICRIFTAQGAKGMINNPLTVIHYSITHNLIRRAGRDLAHRMYVNMHRIIHAQDECTGILHPPFLVFHAEAAVGRAGSVLQLNLKRNDYPL
jgi:hypothetical protein